jgi:putative DNA primase/helicase
MGATRTMQLPAAAAPTVEHALEYARRGWPVFALHGIGRSGRCTCGRPDCENPGKHPQFHKDDLPNGLQDATTDEGLIRRWFGRWPNANIGIRTGSVSGFVVLDVDPRHGGAEALRRLERAHGALPDTIEALTGGGGRHVLLAHPGGVLIRNAAGKLGEGLDVRGDGGYIVAPPGKHASGGRYEWELSGHPDEVPLAPIPGWITRLLGVAPGVERTNGKAPPGDDGGPIPEGQRNPTLTSMAGSMRRYGADPEAIYEALSKVNATRCVPPLGDEEVRSIAQSVGRYAPAPPDPPIDLSDDGSGESPTPQPVGVNLTDRGNALRLVRDHGADLRYCYEFGRWYCWQGTHFAWDVTGEVDRRAKDTVTRMLRRAAALTDPDERKALLKHALRSESTASLRAMLASAQSEAEIAVRSEQLDADRALFNTAGGTLDTVAGTVRECRQSDLITKVAPVKYEPEASCPVFDAFLERVQPQPDVRAFLQRAAGYSLTGLTTERVMFVLYGAGRNGKSTFLEILRWVLGDYATVAPTELLLVKRNEGIPNDLARLKGARFVTASETDEGRRLAEGLVKQITGGDTITARFLHAEFFDFSPQFKLWFSTNHKPVIRGTDAGIWDRICLVPFAVRIADEDVDPELPARLRAEAAGVFNWLLRGLADWRTGGLAPPAAVREATEGYRQEMDVLGAFLDEACLEAPQLKATAKALYATYGKWCERTGETPENQRAFGMRLSERGFQRHRLASGYAWYGVGLRDPDDAEG